MGKQRKITEVNSDSNLVNMFIYQYISSGIFLLIIKLITEKQADDRNKCYLSVTSTKSIINDPISTEQMSQDSLSTGHTSLQTWHS